MLVRLTDPTRYESVTDTYVPVDWGEAFSQIGAVLYRMTTIQTRPTGTPRRRDHWVQ
jgi:hypothetical protein